MRQIERRKILLEAIKEKEYLNIDELENLSNCSHSTLQRDLNILEKAGQIIRSYGGVAYSGLFENTGLMKGEYLQYKKRDIENHEAKRKIALEMVKHIETGDSIYLTHGTTTTQVAKEISNAIHFTIFTDGLDVINALEGKRNIRLLSTGGLVNFSSRQIECSPYVDSAISGANVKKLVMGVGGISIENGITFYDYVSFIFLEKLIEKVDEIIVLADHTKFGKTALANCLPINKISTIITDSMTDTKQLEMLRDLGVECIVV